MLFPAQCTRSPSGVYLTHPVAHQTNCTSARCVGSQCIFTLCAGGWSYFKPKHRTIHVVLLVGAVIDVIFAANTSPTVPRFAAFLRICLLANRSSDIRRELLLVGRIIPEISSVVLLVLLTLAFAAFFGLVLFHEISPHYFGTFWRAMWQLWVLMTTSNFPDVRPGDQKRCFSGARMSS
jgi:hypothetical protein